METETGNSFRVKNVKDKNLYVKNMIMKIKLFGKTNKYREYLNIHRHRNGNIVFNFF